MASFNWPATLQPSKVLWRIRHNVIRSQSMFAGTSQIALLPGSLWEVSMEFPGQLERVRRAHEAFFLSIRGPADRIIMPALDRPTPAGTMRGLPTLASQMEAGSRDATITTTPGATLRVGDFVKLYEYLFMVRVDAVANASGLMNVQFVNTAKVRMVSGIPVLWDRPTGRYMLESDFSGIARSLGGISEPFAVTLVEDFTISA